MPANYRVNPIGGMLLSKAGWWLPSVMYFFAIAKSFVEFGKF
jgi:hypothetical protein